MPMQPETICFRPASIPRPTGGEGRAHTPVLRLRHSTGGVATPAPPKPDLTRRPRIVQYSSSTAALHSLAVAVRAKRRRTGTRQRRKGRRRLVAKRGRAFCPHEFKPQGIPFPLSPLRPRAGAGRGTPANAAVTPCPYRTLTCGTLHGPSGGSTRHPPPAPPHTRERGEEKPSWIPFALFSRSLLRCRQCSSSPHRRREGTPVTLPAGPGAVQLCSSPETGGMRRTQIAPPFGAGIAALYSPPPRVVPTRQRP